MSDVFHRAELAQDLALKLMDPPLASLQKRGFVWRAARGVYALEDSRLATPMRLDGMIE